MPLSNVHDMHTRGFNLTRNDAIKMLLNSLGAMNHNISKLIDNEIEKIRVIVDYEEFDDLSTNDIISTYQNISRVLKNTMNLQILLQAKLDDILVAVLGTAYDLARKETTANAEGNMTSKSPSVTNKRKNGYISVV